MKYAKQYWVFALLLASVIALNLGMDVLMRLSAERMARNLIFPFIMLDPIEKTILLIIIFLVLRHPLGAMYRKLMTPSKEQQSGGGSGGAQPAPNQADQQ
ncbi:hypothetical protein [Paenibacillus montanisoli]|uniref:Uncharacterized protein n=1 Tax=Paenibacillus montanisoli TaxID=2081970 RepID=A0A328TXP0_9BACL|nr:hypothetical protein [Paenibacillus montanisoli]RAP75248.1 hypothetical protein DL346_17900 [Paenibacillus montanisoli]